ncbi:tail fiber protein [Aeribacillus pallidus]|uniref:tail fiber protein n=1 Tax=Aeribacillus pallidus TaxID=33936 RepID=UPI001F07C991|nr:tail fiber protein [Aeribacillus pallidus]
MPFDPNNLPEWNAPGVEPPKSKKDSGWGIQEKPPADWFNWFFNRTYNALKSLFTNAQHKEEKGQPNGYASLNENAKVPTSQLPIATTTSPGAISASDKAKLDGIAPGAEVNQNAFSNVKVGVTTIAADSKTDTLELVAGNAVTLTPDATNDKVTIAVPNATSSNPGAMSAGDKSKLDGIAAGAEVNQNAFANVKVGTTTIAADSKTDTLELVAGQNIILTPDVANDKVNIDVTGVAQANHTHAFSEITDKPTTLDGYGITDAVKTSDVVTSPAANKILKLNANGKLPASITGNADGNAATATKLQTARTLSLSGDVTGSASFDGSANANISATLANSGVTPGTYPKVTVDAKGRVTGGQSLSASDIPNLDWSKITSGKPTTLSGYGITDAIPASQKGAANGVASLDGNTKVPTAQLPAASTSAAGIAQLNDATNSTSTTQAATANAVKKAFDRAVSAENNAKSYTDTEVGEAMLALSLHAGSGGDAHPAATTSTAGFMSAADKTKLNGIASGAEVNQNAYSTIGVYSDATKFSTSFSARNKTDSILLESYGIIELTSLAQNVIRIQANIMPFAHDFLTLQNGWENYGGLFQKARFTKTIAGMVHLSGLVKNGVIGSPIATLPEGCRPRNVEIFRVASAGGTNGLIYVYPDGKITPIEGHTQWITLSGISFLSAEY